MSLHLCVDCAVIYDCYPDAPLICPRCKQPLIMAKESSNNSLTFAEVAVMAIHGEAPRVRRRWSIE